MDGGSEVRDGDGLGAEGDEVGVVGAGEGEYGFGLGECVAGGGFGLAAGGGVNDQQDGGPINHEAVALFGQLPGHSHLCVVERGDQQEPALGQRLLPGALDAHASNAAGRADHDRLGPAQQDFQAVRFDGGVEAAD